MGQKSRQKFDRRLREGKMATREIEPLWTPLEPATVNGNYTAFDGQYYYSVYKNSRYTVLRRICQSKTDSTPEIIHLSIKRNDKKPIWNWRDLQKIKNELIGTECEAVMLFPAESRLVDTSNQYHLYGCSDPTQRFPVGYQERLVAEGNTHGAVQEPFEEHVKPADLQPPDFMKAKMQEYRDKHGLDE